MTTPSDRDKTNLRRWAFEGMQYGSSIEQSVAVLHVGDVKGVAGLERRTANNVPGFERAPAITRLDGWAGQPAAKGQSVPKFKFN